MESELPGPGLTDPIAVVGSPPGFSAEIDLDSWLIVGAPAKVHRKTPSGEWSGSVKGFSAARCSLAIWTLKSGERRELTFFSALEDDYDVGRTFEVSNGRRTWKAEVVESAPATCVTIEYTIQNGAIRSREFFRRGELEVYGKLAPDGKIAVQVPAELPRPGASPRRTTKPSN